MTRYFASHRNKIFGMRNIVHSSHTTQSTFIDIYTDALRNYSQFYTSDQKNNAEYKDAIRRHSPISANSRKGRYYISRRFDRRSPGRLLDANWSPIYFAPLDSRGSFINSSLHPFVPLTGVSLSRCFSSLATEALPEHRRVVTMATRWWLRRRCFLRRGGDRVGKILRRKSGGIERLTLAPEIRDCKPEVNVLFGVPRRLRAGNNFQERFGPSKNIFNRKIKLSAG